MDWIIPCNPNYYNVKCAMTDLKIVDWKQSNKNISAGDIVYIYVGSPISAIKYQCKVNKANIPFCEIDDSKYEINSDVYKHYGNYMELELIKDFPNYLCTISKMRSLGLKGNIQSPRSIPAEVQNLLENFK